MTRMSSSSGTTIRAVLADRAQLTHVRRTRAAVAAAFLEESWDGREIETLPRRHRARMEKLVDACLSDERYHVLYFLERAGEPVGYVHGHRNFSVETCRSSKLVRP